MDFVLVSSPVNSPLAEAADAPLPDGAETVAVIGVHGRRRGCGACAPRARQH